MSEKSPRYNGIKLKKKTTAPTEEGEITVDSADDKIKAYLDSAERAVVTEDQAATLTNKTIDSASNTITIDADEATVSELETDNFKTGVIDTDGTLAANSDTKIPTQQAVKEYVDAQILTTDDASEITYTPSTLTDWDSDTDPGNVDGALDQLAERIDDEEIALAAHLADTTDAHDASAISNVPSGNLAATDVQTALDELQTDVDTRALSSTVTEIDANVDDLITLSGVAENATDLGTFTGTTIADNETVKGALQDLETEVETKASSADLTSHTGASSGVHGVTGSVVGTTNTQTLTNKTLTSPDINTPDIDGGTASNTSRIILPKDTTTNLDLLTDTEALIAYDTTTGNPVYNNGAGWQAIGAGGGGSTEFEINQTTHGFAVGNGIYHNGTNWVKAQANDADTLAYYVVIAVADADNFTAADFGRITATSHGYTIGEFYWLSDSVAGAATNTEPTSGFSNPLFFVEDANTLQVKCLRPTGVDSLNLDELADVSAPSPTDGQGLIYSTSNARWENQDIASASRVRELEKDQTINYITNPDIEDDATGYNTYADAAATTPADGTGGAANITAARNTSTPLRGTGDLLITKDAVNRQGEGVSTDFTISNADKAKKLTISFDYTTSANYADDDIKIFVYDVTNASLIRINGEDLKANANSATHYAQFQTVSDSTSYRLILHVSSTNASTYTVNIDNVKVGPTNLAYGTVVTDWESFTPSFTNFTLGNGTSSGFYRRNGDSIDVAVQINFGSTSSITGDLYIDYPNSLSLDSSKVGTAMANNIADFVDNSTAANRDVGHIRATSSGLLPVTRESNTVTSTSPFTWASGDRLSFIVKSVPIAGWSSNAQISEDLGGREVAVKAVSTTGQSITASTSNVEFNVSEDFDTTASWNGSEFTAPSTGYYIFRGQLRLTAASTGNVLLYVNRNGAGLAYEQFIGHSKDVSEDTKGFSGIVQLNKGDSFVIRFGASVTSSASTTSHFITINKLSSPQTLLETETVAARYYSNSGQTIDNNVDDVVVFEDLNFDTHNAMNTATGEYTVPVSGKYLISSFVTFNDLSVSAGDQVRINVKLDGGILTRKRHTIQGNNTAIQSFDTSAIVDLERGDVITITAFQNTGAGESLRAYDRENIFEIMRIK